MGLAPMRRPGYEFEVKEQCEAALRLNPECEPARKMGQLGR